ncbi:Protein ECERIFERUM 7 [Hibiscus syriacus]|uniref:Protein ECERIFERUM 7 n=1 Tax=Hibiscus syriacus TaxID=106335 RepID=A0A6A3AQV2_HIBSY|nr:Protein ECERIFERUM 7 [Hibiscus syriacus]
MEGRISNAWRLTVNDKNFIKTALLSEIRIDGRKPFEYRKISIKFDRGDGSSEVQIGQTRVMGIVTAQLIQPYKDRPKEGTLSIFTEFSPMADPSFEPGRPGELAVELGRIIDRGLRDVVELRFWFVSALSYSNKDMCKFILGAVFWSIWKMRNEIIFERGKLDTSSLFFTVRLRPVVSWSPPPGDVFMFNVDGAVSSVGMLAGIGGILRDWNQIKLMSFSEKNRSYSNHFSRVESYQKRLRHLSVIRMGNEGKDIAATVSENEVIVRWIPRSCNCEVDLLAKEGIGESRAVDTESLCILAGKYVWAIRIDLHILDNGGNLVDAANIAALAALLTYLRPECSLGGEDGQEVIVHPPEIREPLPLTVHHLPIAITFGFFGNEGILLIDPTHNEEAVMGGRMTMTVNANGDICAIQKGGGEGVPQRVIMKCLQLATSKAASITKQIKDAVEAFNTERALRKIKRHPTSTGVDVRQKQNQ